jgi:brefeldin A-inhibited guanine nucleotide-exchange protein
LATSDFCRMEFFVTQTIKRIRGLSSRSHKELRAACDETTKAIEANKGKEGKEDTDADKYFRPFQLACGTSNAKMISAALDCTQKLIAYGYLTGETNVVDPTTGESRKLMDIVVETICACNSHTDENVQLQVIKALLTAVSCNHCEIHETSLLLAVRACYHIHLVSRNSVNRTTAKGTLKQMLNICFQKMEAYDIEHGAELEDLEKKVRHEEAAARESPGVSGGNAPRKPEKPEAGKEEDAQDGDRRENVTLSADAALRVRRDLLWNQGKDYKKSIAWRAGPNMYPHTYISLGYTSVGHDMADLDLYEDVRGEQASGANGVGSPVAKKGSSDFEVGADGLALKQAPNDPFRSLFHKDAFLLFRSLCKLSMKSKAKEGGMEQADPVALQTKLLSLELIRGVLETAGPSFRKGAKFVYAVKHYLCNSLIKNCVSSNTRVVNLSLHIFVALISHFKDYLRSEIEVFVSTIFLRILEEETSDIQHRLLVLEVFYKLCQDGQTIVELFINYDCGMGISADDVSTEQGLFERIVDVLSEMAQMDCTGDPEKAGVRHRRKLRLLALQSVVALSKCLVEISSRDNPSAEGEEDAGGGDVSTPLRRNRTSTVEALKSGASSGASTPNVGERSDGDGAMQTPTERSVADAVSSFDKKQRIKRELEEGILQFNKKPKKGIVYLLDRGHLELLEKSGTEQVKPHEAATPESVAAFLIRYCEGGKVTLEKTVIGDYLGEGKDYNLLVLHRYVDLLHFTGMEVDEAIRKYLSGFRLPGEAQKIDRMMEKFAERYCQLNEGVFPSADTAFVLSYSIIMLQTDLHNPNIKAEKKMKKEEYLRNNRGIANGEDLPKEFLGGIYDRIKATPITLKEDDTKRQKLQKKGRGNTMNKRAAARRLQEDIERQAVDRMRRRPSMTRALRHGDTSLGAEAFYTMDALSVSTKDHVRPMFTVLWAPLIAVYNLLLDTGNEEDILRLCLEGIQYGVRIAGVFDMHDERHTYMKTVANFTNLESSKLLDMKNIECIRVILKIALEEGEHLRQSWEQVLGVMSLLSRLEMLATTPRLGDDIFFQTKRDDDQSSDKKEKKGSVFSAFGYSHAAMAEKAERRRRMEKMEEIRELERNNAVNIVELVDLKSVERVFNKSVNFSEEAIVSFVTCLCDVARLELLGPEDEEKRKALEMRNAAQPRVFCLQKLVEVASYNMETRTHLVWSQLWRHISNLFTEVGVHENPSVAMYAIDSLKQLGMKFLEKSELSHFNFQSIFLIPFERIMQKSPALEIKELVLRVIDNITQARVGNIMSGWRAIFSVYACAGSEAVESLNILAYDAVERIFSSHYHVAKESFVDLVNCYSSFAKNQAFLQTSCNAIKRISLCAEKLAADRTAAMANSDSSDKFAFTDSKADTGAWWPILTGLANLVMDRREPVRTLSLDSLFHILAEQGHLFSSGLWELIFKGVLFPIFDDVRHSHMEIISNSNVSGKVVMDSYTEEWLRSTCQDALNSIVSLFSKRESFGQLQFLLSDVFQLLQNCIVHPNQLLARKGVACLKTLLSDAGNNFDDATWTIAAEKVNDMFLKTIPTQLMKGKETMPSADDAGEDGESDPPERDDAPENALPFSPHRVLSMCFVQLDLVQVVNDITEKHWKSMKANHISCWLTMLKEVFTFASDFNKDLPLRVHLLNAGFMRMLNMSGHQRPPSLLNQESQALSVYLKILIRVGSRPIVEENQDQLALDADEKLGKVCARMMKRYLHAEQSSLVTEQAESEPTSWTAEETMQKSENERTAQTFCSIVMDVLTAWGSATRPVFQRHESWLKPLLFEMIMCENVDLRKALKRVLLVHL